MEQIYGQKENSGMFTYNMSSTSLWGVFQVIVATLLLMLFLMFENRHHKVLLLIHRGVTTILQGATTRIYFTNKRIGLYEWNYAIQFKCPEKKFPKADKKMKKLNVGFGNQNLVIHVSLSIFALIWITMHWLYMEALFCVRFYYITQVLLLDTDFRGIAGESYQTSETLPCYQPCVLLLNEAIEQYMGNSTHKITQAVIVWFLFDRMLKNCKYAKFNSLPIFPNLWQVECESIPCVHTWMRLKLKWKQSQICFGHFTVGLDVIVKPIAIQSHLDLRLRQVM